eukprot:9319622-Alexandrium_andersonii.AAC.1
MGMRMQRPLGPPPRPTPMAGAGPQTWRQPLRSPERRAACGGAERRGGECPLGRRKALRRGS